jgi:hypothetical protein
VGGVAIHVEGVVEEEEWKDVHPHHRYISLGVGWQGVPIGSIRHPGAQGTVLGGES